MRYRHLRCWSAATAPATFVPRADQPVQRQIGQNACPTAASNCLFKNPRKMVRVDAISSIGVQNFDNPSCHAPGINTHSSDAACAEA